MYRRLALLIVAILTALLVAGCESRPPQGVNATQPRTVGEDQARADELAGPPSEQRAQPGESSTPASRPSARAGSGETTEIGGETPSAAKTVEPEPRLPDYLKILERFDDRARVEVHVRLEPPVKLEIQTDNVKRLRITRVGLPLVRGRSTVLRIDEQVFEWPQRSEVVELERSPNGVWMSVKLRKSRP
jgi:hypothetical protein